MSEVLDIVRRDHVLPLDCHLGQTGRTSFKFRQYFEVTQQSPKSVAGQHTPILINVILYLWTTLLGEAALLQFQRLPHRR